MVTSEHANLNGGQLEVPKSVSVLLLQQVRASIRFGANMLVGTGFRFSTPRVTPWAILGHSVYMLYSFSSLGVELVSSSNSASERL